MFWALLIGFIGAIVTSGIICVIYLWMTSPEREAVKTQVRILQEAKEKRLQGEDLLATLRDIDAVLLRSSEVREAIKDLLGDAINRT